MLIWAFQLQKISPSVCIPIEDENGVKNREETVMPKEKREGRLEEVFILLNRKTAEATAEVAAAIEAIGGRPLYLYPPGTIITLIPKKKIEQLKVRECPKLS